MELDVLDDLKGEAAECHANNPWLTYSLPLHHIREWGAPEKLFDLIDERPLLPLELARFADEVLRCSQGPGASFEGASFEGASFARVLEDEGPDRFGAGS